MAQLANVVAKNLSNGAMCHSSMKAVVTTIIVTGKRATKKNNSRIYHSRMIVEANLSLGTMASKQGVANSGVNPNHWKALRPGTGREKRATAGTCQVGGLHCRALLESTCDFCRMPPESTCDFCRGRFWASWLGVHSAGGVYSTPAFIPRPRW